MTLSASRLNGFLGCAHSTALSLAGVPEAAVDDATVELLRKKGFEHEARVLAALEAEAKVKAVTNTYGSNAPPLLVGKTISANAGKLTDAVSSRYSATWLKDFP